MWISGETLIPINYTASQSTDVMPLAGQVGVPRTMSTPMRLCPAKLLKHLTPFSFNLSADCYLFQTFVLIRSFPAPLY